MPVIVIGADSPLGRVIASHLAAAGGEVRAFVSDPAAADALRAAGIKVALGDVSDDSHVGGAALGCFSAVIVPAAAVDERERAFADSPTAVITAWVDALTDAAVRRVIWIDDERIPDAAARFDRAVVEVATVDAADATPAEVADEVARLDALRDLGEV